MKSDGKLKIAGKYSVDDWFACKAGLVIGGDPDAWKSACDKFFIERLQTRYLDPIKALQSSKLLKGEGFSIVTLQCSLIEFLGSTIEGMSYRYAPDNQLRQFEYKDSKNLFIRFLTTIAPFKKSFPQKKLAKDFYEGVRCGLLHEARTKRGWKILASPPSGMAIDAKSASKVVYRNDLQLTFHEFVDWYKAELPKNKKLQEAFIRKFDSLCQE